MATFIAGPHRWIDPSECLSTRAQTSRAQVKAIYGYEPAAYVYPKGEPRPEIRNSSGAIYRTDTYEVPLEDFMKLTKIPICIVYGDNIPTSPDPVLARDGRRCQVLAAKLFVDALKRHGGDATYLSFPEAGLKGSTHFIGEISHHHGHDSVPEGRALGPTTGSGGKSK